MFICCFTFTRKIALNNSTTSSDVKSYPDIQHYSYETISAICIYKLLIQLIILVFVLFFADTVPKLTYITRQVIRRQLGQTGLMNIDQLLLPKLLKNYIEHR